MIKNESKEKPDISVVTLTPDKIHHEISRHIANGVTYIDALVDYAERNGIEIETIAQIVKKSSVLKEKIRTEAVCLRMVQKEDEQDITDFSK
jgi:predicted aldo/keto reductase-like oxidoreductase